MKFRLITTLLFSSYTVNADLDLHKPKVPRGEFWDTLKSAPQESTKLLANDGAEGDLFGISVSLSGDRALIGSYRDDDNGLSSGSAYIFEYDGLNWVFKTKLLAPDGETGDLFGWSVSLNADRAMVGAFLDDGLESDSGSAYIFEFDGQDWPLVQKITATDGLENDWFGSSVSISGDFALVGAEYGDGQVIDSGSAYVYFFDGKNWIELTKLFTTDGVLDDRFGGSVSLYGNRALIGAINGTGQMSNSGSAYVFNFDVKNMSWSQGALLSASNGSVGDLFGQSVSLSDSRALIGAHRTDNDFGSSTGSAYVFEYDGMNWNQSAELTADDAGSGDRFGYSVSISGNTVLIGAPYDDAQGGDSGSAYLFHHEGGNWIQKSKLVQPDGNSDNRFAYSVSQSAQDALISAYRDDDLGLDSGSALVFKNALDLIYYDGFEMFTSN